METWLRDNEHGIKTLATILAAIFALIQYFDHLNGNRVEQTLEFYKRFSSEPVYSARLGISKTWETLWPEIIKIPTPNNDDEKKINRKEWKKLVITKLTNDAIIISQTDTLFDFFSALQVCIENDICDKTSAVELLQGSAKGFIENNCPYVAYMRYDRKSKQFGEKAATFAGKPCSVEIFKN